MVTSDIKAEVKVEVKEEIKEDVLEGRILSQSHTQSSYFMTNLVDEVVQNFVTKRPSLIPDLFYSSKMF